MDYKEFSAKIKQKYPQYGDMNDLDLAQKIVAKYPKEYADVTFPQQAQYAKPLSLTERFIENAQQPFSNLAKMTNAPAPLRGLASMLDVPAGMAGNLFQASGKLGKSLQPDNFNPLGATEAATRIGATALSAPFLPIMTGVGMATKVLPESAQNVLGAVSNPAKSVLGPTEEAAIADNLLQGITSGIALKKGLTSPTNFRNQRMALAEENVLRSAPPKGEANFNIDADFKKFAPFLKEEAKKGFESKRINRETDLKINKSLSNYYNRYIQPQIDRAQNQGAEIPLSSVRDKMLATISKTDEIIDPNKKATVEGIANRLPEKMSLKEANDYVKDLNAKTQNLESLSNADYSAKISADPALEARVTLRKALRDAIVDKLDEYGEFNTKKLRETYGSGARLRDLVHDNVLSAENQARLRTIELGGRYNPIGIAENVVSKVLGRTKEGEMKKGMTRVGRYAPNPEPPQVPNATLLDILYRNRYGAE